MSTPPLHTPCVTGRERDMLDTSLVDFLPPIDRDDSCRGLGDRGSREVFLEDLGVGGCSTGSSVGYRTGSPLSPSDDFGGKVGDMTG